MSSKWTLEEEKKLIIEDLKSNIEKINQHGMRAEKIIKSMLVHSRNSGTDKIPAYVTKIAYLVIGGGGGGGHRHAGGGGAGEVLFGTANVNPLSTISVTVGAGGIGAPQNAGACDYGRDGSSTTLVLSSGTITAKPGGAGARKLSPAKAAAKKSRDNERAERFAKSTSAEKKPFRTNAFDPDVKRGAAKKSAGTRKKVSSGKGAPRPKAKGGKKIAAKKPRHKKA